MTCVSCAGKGTRLVAAYRGGPKEEVECWWCRGSGQSADACCTCGTDDEERCDYCAMNTPDPEDDGDEEGT